MRKLLIVGVGLAIVGVVVVALPFNRPAPTVSATTSGFLLETSPPRCRAPIVSAWRAEHASGWFGYAPLTSTPSNVVIQPCRTKARRRLAGGVLFVACGVAVAIVARRRPKRPAADPAA